MSQWRHNIFILPQAFLFSEGFLYLNREGRADLMKKVKETLGKSKNAIEVLEFLKTARTVKRQMKLLRGLDLEEKETKIIKEVLDGVNKELSMFR